MITIITQIGDNVHGSQIPMAYLWIYAILLVAIPVAFYVLRSIGLYKLAKRAGLNCKAMALIPFVWMYVACKLIGKDRVFNTTFEKLAVLFCIVFSLAEVFAIIYEVLLYFPIVGNLLLGRNIYIIHPNIKVDSTNYVPTLLEGIYGLKNEYVDPYGSAYTTVYNILNVIYYAKGILDIASIVISVTVFFNLFKKYWPQHHVLCGLLSIFGLFGPFVFAIRNREPIKYADYLRSRFGAYGPYGQYGNPYGQYGNPYQGQGQTGAQGGYQRPPETPFSEFAEKGEVDPGDPFEEFNKKDNNEDEN